ncbi:MAG: helix-turn-helix transcriptional regulator [Spirochaetota bacterium]
MRLQVSIILYGDTRCVPSWAVDETGSGYHRLYHIYDGGCTFSMNGKDTHLSKGLYLLPSQRAYTLSHDRRDPLTCRWFHITISPPIISPLVRIPIRGAISSMLASISEVMRTRITDALPSLIEALITVIRSEGHIDSISDERLARVLAAVHDDMTSSNERLAAIAGLSREYFIRLFEKTFSMTPQDYIAELRIVRAKGLIASGEKIVSVAAAVGFSDDKAFSRFFKARTGMKPTAYRSVRQP